VPYSDDDTIDRFVGLGQPMETEGYLHITKRSVSSEVVGGKGGGYIISEWVVLNGRNGGEGRGYSRRL
jgi:hypothetical protein